jgi:hypothetical protein
MTGMKVLSVLMSGKGDVIDDINVNEKKTN